MCNKFISYTQFLLGDEYILRAREAGLAMLASYAKFSYRLYSEYWHTLRYSGYPGSHLKNFLSFLENVTALVPRLATRTSEMEQVDKIGAKTTAIVGLVRAASETYPAEKINDAAKALMAKYLVQYPNDKLIQ